MEEVRITDPVTGGMKGQKECQHSLVDPMLRHEALEDWPFEARRVCAYALLDFEEGLTRADTLVELGWQLLVNYTGSRILAVDALANVYGFGSRKYDRGNWRKGYAWSLSIDAAWRHLIAGKDLDAESGLPHAAHFLWHCCCLRDFETMKLGTDDRLYLRPEPRPEVTWSHSELKEAPGHE